MECTWDETTREECAVNLCAAAGFETGSFVSSDVNACWYSSTDDEAWHWVLDEDTYDYGWRSREAAVTAECGTEVPDGLVYGDVVESDSKNIENSPPEVEATLTVLDYESGTLHDDATVECTAVIQDLDGDMGTLTCLLYTSPSPRDYAASRMPSSA